MIRVRSFTLVLASSREVHFCLVVLSPSFLTLFLRRDQLSAISYNLSELLENFSSFVMPSHQRMYEWPKSMAIELLDDLLRAFQTEDSIFFAGTFVLLSPDVKAKKQKAEIFDGQQRLTTLHVILFAAWAVEREASRKEKEKGKGKEEENEEEENEEEEEQEDEWDYSLKDLQMRKLKRPKLHLFKEDDTRILEIWKSASSGKIDHLDRKGPRVLRNFHAVVHRLKQKLEEGVSLNAFADWVMETVQFVVVLAKSSDIAGHIFAVTNTPGLGLSPGDRLKSDFINMVESSFYDDAVKEQARIWNYAEDSFLARYNEPNSCFSLSSSACVVSAVNSLWGDVSSDEKSLQAAEFKNPPLHLLKHTKLQEFKSSCEVFEKFFLFCSGFGNFTEKDLKSFLRRDEKLSIPLVKSVVNDINRTLLFLTFKPFCKRDNSELRWLDLLLITIAPGILDGVTLGTFSEFSAFLWAIERFSVSLLLPHHLGRKSHEVFLKAFDQMIRIRQSKPMMETLKQATEVVEELIRSEGNIALAIERLTYEKCKSEQNDLMTYLLLRSEYQRVSGAANIMTSMPIVRSNLSLEHVFPQNPKTGNWSEDWVSMKPFKHGFGNLMVVSQSLNSQLSNKTLEEKSMILAKCAPTDCVPRLTDKLTEWTSKSVAKREKELLGKISTMLVVPKTTVVSITPSHSLQSGVANAGSPEKKQPETASLDWEQKFDQLLALPDLEKRLPIRNKERISVAQFTEMVTNTRKALADAKVTFLSDWATVTKGSSTDAVSVILFALNVSIPASERKRAVLFGRLRDALKNFNPDALAPTINTPPTSAIVSKTTAKPPSPKHYDLPSNKNLNVVEGGGDSGKKNCEKDVVFSGSSHKKADNVVAQTTPLKSTGQVAQKNLVVTPKSAPDPPISAMDSCDHAGVAVASSSSDSKKGTKRDREHLDESGDEPIGDIFKRAYTKNNNSKKNP